MIYCKKKLDNSSLYKLIKNYYELRCPATYTKKGNYQCRSNASRSFTDLMMLSKYYFPKTTNKQLAKTLKKLGVLRIIGGVYCSDIESITFYNKKSHESWGSFLRKGDNHSAWTDDYGTQKVKGEIVSKNQFNKLLNK